MTKIKKEKNEEKSAVEIRGIYPIDASEPCYLIELKIYSTENLIEKIENITQSMIGEPKANWQCPWDEVFLNADGTKIIEHSDFSVKNEVRVVFFFHYLVINKPLLTPWKELILPSPTPLPQRLEIISYDPPF